MIIIYMNYILQKSNRQDKKYKLCKNNNCIHFGAK